ncbi:MAG: hypothetical protein HQL52_05755 [Magnetococcales bacterium]|nr:hypothetical protein [Magnetococcales bacterium]
MSQNIIEHYQHIVGKMKKLGFSSPLGLLWAISTQGTTMALFAASHASKVTI